MTPVEQGMTLLPQCLAFCLRSGPVTAETAAASRSEYDQLIDLPLSRRQWIMLDDRHQCGED